MYLQTKVNEHYLGASIYEAMEFWSLPKPKRNQIEEMCNNGKYFAQVKKDGNWYEYSKSTTGIGYLFSRGVSTKTGLPVESIANIPHIAKAFECLPNDTVLVGEIYYPGETSNEVRSIMGCLPKKAIERQKEKGGIHFYLFDVLKFNGKDCTELGAIERFNILQDIINCYNLLQYDFIEIAEIVTENIFEFLTNTMASNEEGVVLKLKTAPYAEGKRPAWSSIKWKKQDDVDLVCMGFEDATRDYTGTELESWEYWYDIDSGKKLKGHYYNQSGENSDGMIIPITKPYFFGWKTSIKIGGYNEQGVLEQIGNVSSGLSDEMRSEFAMYPDKYIGKVVAINCMEITKDSLRHPILVRFRDDKNASSCILKNIFT